MCSFPILLGATSTQTASREGTAAGSGLTTSGWCFKDQDLLAGKWRCANAAPSWHLRVVLPCDRSSVRPQCHSAWWLHWLFAQWGLTLGSRPQCCWLSPGLDDEHLFKATLTSDSVCHLQVYQSLWARRHQSVHPCIMSAPTDLLPFPSYYVSQNILSPARVLKHIRSTGAEKTPWIGKRA